MKPSTSSSQQATTTTSNTNNNPNSFISNINNNNNQSLAIDGLHDVYLSKCSLFGLRPDPAVAQRLRHFDRTRAREYDFSGIRAGDTFRCILDALIAAPDLETLVWRGGGLTDGHVEALVNAARRFIGLESIDLGENEGITDVGGTLLLKFILDNNNNKHDGGKTSHATATTSVNLVQTSCTATMIKKIQATQVVRGRNAHKNSGESTPVTGASNRNNNHHNNYVMSPPLREYLNGNNKNKTNENVINPTEAGLLQSLEQQRSKISEVYYQQQNNNNNFNPSSSTTKANTHHVLNFLTIFHSIICHLLALALWIPHNRFKTLIFCFSYFVGVILTFGPSSSVMDTMAITMIFIGVQRWRQYYAKSTVTAAASLANGNNEINGTETARDLSPAMNVFASTFAHLTQGARRRWSEFLDPLEQLTNMLNVATKKQEEIMSFSSSTTRKRRALGEEAEEKNIHLANGDPEEYEEAEAEKIFHGYYQQQIEGDLRDERDQNNVILFEQMVRNCAFQYMQFLLNVVWFDPQTHFILFGTATVSVVSAFAVRLVTGYSAFAVGVMFVIWGALFFGIEPVLASDLLLLPFDEDALNNGGNIRSNNNSNNSNGCGSLSSSSSTSATRSSRNLNLSAIIRFYRVRIGRWIAGNPVRSADDDATPSNNVNNMITNTIASNFSSASASPIMPSLLQQNGKQNNNNNPSQLKSSARRDPFSFVVEIIRIEDCIIRTSNSNNSDNNNSKPIVPLAKVRCMNKSWTTSEADARSSYSASTRSHITTSAAWARGESSQPFNSPHPFDTAKMTFSIYDTSPSASTSHVHNNNYFKNNNNNNNQQSGMILSSYDDGILEVLLQGTFLIDDDLAFGTEIAIPLKSVVLVNEGNNNLSSNAAGSGSGRGGIWSLSEMLLRQIDEKDAGERIKNVAPGNGNPVGNHQKSNRNNNDYNHGTSSSASPSFRKEYFVERAGVLIIRFTEVGGTRNNGDQQYVATSNAQQTTMMTMQMPPRLLQVSQQNEKSLHSTLNNSKSFINNAKPSAEPVRFDNNDERELIDYDDDNDEVILNHHQIRNDNKQMRNSKSTTTTHSTATTASPVPRRHEQQQQQQQNPPMLVVTGSRESKASSSPMFPPIASAGPQMKNKDPNFLSVEVLQRHDTQEEIFLDHEQSNNQQLLSTTDNNNRPMNRRNSSQVLTFNQQVAISSGRVASNVPSGNNNQRIATTKKQSDTRSQGSVQYLPDDNH